MTFSSSLMLSLFITFASSSTNVSTYLPHIPVNPSLDKPYVYMTINQDYSYIKDDFFDMNIEIYWKPPKNWTKADSVELHIKKPYGSHKLFEINISDSKPGYVLTNYTIKTNETRQMTKDGCLDSYWVVYSQAGKNFLNNCFKVRPHWMEEEQHLIGHLPLNRLMIPGTKNSALIAKKDNFQGSLFPYHQAESIWNQLIYGIRYIELDVGYHPSPDDTHDYGVIFISIKGKKMTPLYKHIFDIIKFIGDTEEIVIVKFNKFYNFNKHAHRTLTKMCNGYFNNYIKIINQDLSKLTYNKLKEMKKRILVFYENDTDSSLITLEKTTDKPNTLVNYISKSLTFTNKFSVSYLTLSKNYGFFNYITNFLFLKIELAQLSNVMAKQLTPALKREKFQKYGNIIATNFFRGNDVIDECILANRKRAYLKPKPT